VAFRSFSRTNPCCNARVWPARLGLANDEWRAVTRTPGDETRW
jgi:hypothetical protein